TDYQSLENAFAAFKAIGKPALPPLIERLGDQFEQPHVVWALGQIGRPAVPALVASLQDKDSLLRAGAASAVGFMGNEAAAAVPASAERSRTMTTGFAARP